MHNVSKSVEVYVIILLHMGLPIFNINIYPYYCVSVNLYPPMAYNLTSSNLFSRSTELAATNIASADRQVEVSTTVQLVSTSYHRTAMDYALFLILQCNAMQLTPIIAESFIFNSILL